MSWSLAQRVAVVTGVTSSLGEGITAELLRRRIQHVVVVGRNETKLQSMLHRLEKTQDLKIEKVVTPIVADITSAEDCKNLIASAVKAGGTGHIDAMVHCAGVTRDKLFVTCSDEDIEHVWQTNVLAPLRLTRLALRNGKMLQKKDGSVVFVGSVVSRSGNQGQVAYASSKAALEGAVVSLAREYGPTNIRFNVVAPGLIQETGMHSQLSETARNSFAERTCLKRCANVDEVSDVIVSTLQATYTTGAVVRVDGGTL